MRCLWKNTPRIGRVAQQMGFIPALALYLFEKGLGDEVHQSSVYSGTYVFVGHHAQITSERILWVHHEHAFIGIIKDESPTNYEEVMMGPNVLIYGIVQYNPK